jgi:DNA mismatch repair protein MutL
MGKIRVLDDNMINMIAAGEVVERPASVVKELLENSIDAGATRIVVKIEDGGRRLISITDNGCGIDAGDIPTAFAPHATSKLRTDADLGTISTMGFRGEALASIASVSGVTITSRTDDSIQANRLEIDCGKRGEVTPCSGDKGTTIEVRNLFYKLPARRKFLRTANTEMTHISEYFTRIALAHCHLDLTLIHNGRQLHRLLGNQPLTERIGELFSKGIASDLIEVSGDERGVKISALLGRPDRARANNKFQYVFVNRRYIRDKFIGHAMREAYRGLIEPNKYAVVFLFIELPVDAYDVNVHPMKIEVRFENSNMIHSQVLAVLREKLLSMDLEANAQIPASSIDIADKFPQSPEDAARQQRISSAMSDFFKTHTQDGASQQKFPFPPSQGSSGGASHGSYSPYSQGSQGGYDPGKAPMGDVNYSPAPFEGGAAGSAGPQTFLQVHNSYILTETNDGFVIVDQHALHERIIYEQLCRKLADGQVVSQRLLIPETFEVNDAQLEAIKSNAELIEKIGIELEPFGPKTMAIQSFPVILEKVNPLDFMQDMLDMLTDKTTGLDAERLLHEVLDMAACKAAIKAGQSLTDEEMRQLIADKDTVERASRCPHGRPTVIKFSISDLEKQFKRT